MAWEARSALKLPEGMPPDLADLGLNGLGSPFGIETRSFAIAQDDRRNG